ncbi:MAG: hypothetical protein B7Z40_22530 [Bosea sp. 12-68-7]|nr:MAG: hypothetical protein B7Z40_22530 [Bosea sp. 12-68-7]
MVRCARRPRVLDPPPGFAPHFRKSPLTDAWEPLYSKREGDVLTIGVLVATPHTNARGMAHGGLIAALADNAMGLACALIGDWLEVAATPVRVGRTLAFGEARVTTGDRLIARASAVFSIPPAASVPPADAPDG